tara:strand:- start:1642 stop:1848 length:207 start_codon:yes stop_codon:yes gene_type:complete
MYKITNKSTGFIQYRDAKDLATFIYYNEANNYTIEEIQNFDLLEFISKIAFVVMMLGLVYAFFYFGLS